MVLKASCCNAATGSKRRKITRTVINSKGEEVTEEVWEEEPNEAADKALDKTNSPASKPHILLKSMLCLIGA